MFLIWSLFCCKIINWHILANSMLQKKKGWPHQIALILLIFISIIKVGAKVSPSMGNDKNL